MGFTYLHVYGRINNLTVKSVKIKDFTNVPVKRDGSFSCMYPISSSPDKLDFDLSGRREEAELSFGVRLIESKNNIRDIGISPVIQKPSDAGGREIYTGEQYIKLSGYYYGLEGVQAGYMIKNMTAEIFDSENPQMQNDITYDMGLDIKLYEDNRNGFRKNYTLEGEILSLYKIYNIKVRSGSESVRFEGDSREITVPVDGLNRFKVTAYIDMPENVESEDYRMDFFPEPPFLNWMKRGGERKL